MTSIPTSTFLAFLLFITLSRSVTALPTVDPISLFDQPWYPQKRGDDGQPDKSGHPWIVVLLVVLGIIIIGALGLSWLFERKGKRESATKQHVLTNRVSLPMLGIWLFNSICGFDTDVFL